MKLFVLATMMVLAAGPCSSSDGSVDGGAETTASTLDSAGAGALPANTHEEAIADVTASGGGAPPVDGALPMLTPEPGSGYKLAPGERALIWIGLHCGVRVLDWPLNERVWQALEGAGILDWVPPEWPVDPTMPDGPLMVEAHLSDDGDLLTLSLDERHVLYESTGTEYGADQLCAGTT